MRKTGIFYFKKSIETCWYPYCEEQISLNLWSHYFEKWKWHKIWFKSLFERKMRWNEIESWIWKVDFDWFVYSKEEFLWINAIKSRKWHQISLNRELEDKIRSNLIRRATWKLFFSWYLYSEEQISLNLWFHRFEKWKWIEILFKSLFERKKCVGMRLNH